MSSGKGILFTPAELKRITLPNRFVRSATYEGYADGDGIVSGGLADAYRELAGSGTGTIITGFCYVSRQGRAMHPGQAGIDREECTKAWAGIIERVRKVNPKTKLIMQIAHAGRQTLSKVTGCDVVSPGEKRCGYFRQRVRALSSCQIKRIIEDFAKAGRRAMRAGFDGIQVHAAHGYLIHQFLSRDTNTRSDRWADRNLFLIEVLKAIRDRCGEDFPVLIKLSHSDDGSLTTEDTIETVNAAADYIDAAEISYGTMEYALNIFRGGCDVDTVLKVNPLFNRMPGFVRWLWKKRRMNGYLERFKPFSVNYNLDAAVKIAGHTDVPVIPVGGIRNLKSMTDIIAVKSLAAVSLCRPFICEPGLVNEIDKGIWRESKCTNCNLCAVHCDSNNSLRCYYDHE